jgi:hypothetical protein
MDNSQTHINPQGFNNNESIRIPVNGRQRSPRTLDEAFASNKMNELTPTPNPGHKKQMASFGAPAMLGAEKTK